MAKDPAVLLYTADFLVGIMTMDDEQVGKYIRLLCLQHQKGHLTENEMLKVCRIYDESVFSKFVTDKDGLYYNKRMDDEINKRAKGSDASRENGKKGGRPNIHQAVFDHYISLDLIKHKQLTSDMRKAIDKAKRSDYTLDDMKMQLDRHALVVKASENDGDYKVKKRTLIEFFGQRVHNASHLICSEYTDDGTKWRKYQSGGYGQEKKKGKSGEEYNPFLAAAKSMGGDNSG